MNKCKGCEWHNKPYWSIINPCENCPKEETNVAIITRWIDPTIEEKDKEIERLHSIIETTKIFVEKYNDKPFDIEVREMILKCLNDEVKGSDKEWV